MKWHHTTKQHITKDARDLIHGVEEALKDPGLTKLEASYKEWEDEYGEEKTKSAHSYSYRALEMQEAIKSNDIPKMQGLIEDYKERGIYKTNHKYTTDDKLIQWTRIDGI